ncbi:Uncharacterised protein [Mycobacteroides abscessus subsp. abscessus]|nr:Uncharacterised protein [Mycobacteroides abscessus subsp. abscessus]
MQSDSPRRREAGDPDDDPRPVRVSGDIETLTPPLHEGAHR